MLEKSNYQLIKEIDIINNKKKIVFLNILALPILLLSFPFFSSVATLGYPNKTINFSSNSLLETIMLLILFIIIIIIHELIHGLFMKLFNKEGNVKFGLKNGMAYATSPESLYNKKHFAIISLAPFAILSIALILMHHLGLLSPFTFISIASIHTAGCVGDFYWVYLIIKSPSHTLIEDTEIGINFYQKKD